MDTGEELEKLLARYGYEWPHFEANEKGEIQIKDPLWGENTFKMRIGLHMNRPTQAIIALNQFVRLRAAPDFADYSLSKLDPCEPDACLYPHNGLLYIEQSYNRWKPQQLNQTKPQQLNQTILQQQMLQAQAAMQQAQTVYQYQHPTYLTSGTTTQAVQTTGGWLTGVGGAGGLATVIQGLGQTLLASQLPPAQPTTKPKKKWWP